MSLAVASAFNEKRALGRYTSGAIRKWLNQRQIKDVIPTRTQNASNDSMHLALDGNVFIESQGIETIRVINQAE